MINKELLSRHRILNLKIFIAKSFVKEIDDRVKDIEESPRYTAALESVQQTEEFKDKLEKYTQSLTNSMARQELNIADSTKWAAERHIKDEIDAKLAVTKIGTFEDIVKSVTDGIQIEDFIG